ncbi:MAG: hypothetical protein ACOC7M_03540, partial [Chloroflexota bacterium]
MRMSNTSLISVLLALLASGMMLVPGCGTDQLPAVPDANDGNGGTEADGGGDNGEPTQVPGDDPPQVVPLHSGSVRVRYVAEDNQGMATYAVPADAEDIIAFYRTEFDQLGWESDYEESNDDKMILGVQDVGGQTIVVEVHYD